MDYNLRSSRAISEQNIAGQIQKVFGRHGEVVVRLWDNFPEEIDDEPFWIEIDSRGVPVFVKSIKNQGMTKAVIVFEDWETEELATELVGKNLYFEKNEESLDDSSMLGLVGWSIYDHVSNKTGIITDFNQSEINPLLSVEFDCDEHLIPLAEEYIISFDENTKKIEVQLPDGLLDL